MNAPQMLMKGGKDEAQSAGSLSGSWVCSSLPAWAPQGDSLSSSESSTQPDAAVHIHASVETETPHVAATVLTNLIKLSLAQLNSSRWR